jgi:NAD-dependent deacetylase
VWPVAGLPEEALRHGGKLAIVDRDPTPYDARADLVVHDSAGEVLAKCVTSMSSS